jgi:hypothetical protein
LDPDPFTGQYPSFSHALNPATNVASRHAGATSNCLLSDGQREPSAHIKQRLSASSAVAAQLGLARPRGHADSEPVI